MHTDEFDESFTSRLELASRAGGLQRAAFYAGARWCREWAAAHLSRCLYGSQTEASSDAAAGSGIRGPGGPGANAFPNRI